MHTQTHKYACTYASAHACFIISFQCVFDNHVIDDLCFRDIVLHIQGFFVVVLFSLLVG